MSKPRKRRVDTATITNDKKREVAKIVEQLIKESGLTQKEFAKATGVGYSTISNLLSHTKQKIPSSKILKKIASYASDSKKCYIDLMYAAGYIDMEEALSFNPGTQILRNRLYDSKKEQLIKKIEDFTNGTFCRSGNNNFDISLVAEKFEIVEWNISFQSEVKDFVWSILLDGANPLHKYSIYIEETDVLNDLLQLNLPSLNVAISVIKNEDGKYIETYVSTGFDTDKLSVITLS